MKVEGLMLAAGLSRRMGRFKPLLMLDGRCMAARTADNLLQGGAQACVVVTGHRREELVAELRDERLRFAINPHSDVTDMLHSVRIGIRALRPDTDAVLLTPADIPLVLPKTIGEMVRLLQTTGAAVVQPAYQGQTGHPIAMARRCFADILCGDAPKGLRSILERYEGQTVLLDTEDFGILPDADTPEEFERITELYYKRKKEEGA